MSRPIRLEFPGALYHVTSRVDRREEKFFGDADRRACLGVLANTCERFNWRVHAGCQMGNHCHLLLETPEGNLSAGMRQLNGVYTQHVNRVHRRVGHVFQGRCRAVLVERESHLLELARDVVLNPVRAAMVADAADWAWSSHAAAMLGDEAVPEWLEVEALLARHFGVHYATVSRAVRAHEGRPGAAAPLFEAEERLP